MTRAGWIVGAVVVVGCAVGRPSADPGMAEAESNDAVDAAADAGISASPPTAPTPTPSKIKYIYVIEKENHTFDNLFAGFPGAESVTVARTSDGRTVPLTRAPDAPLPKDLPHDHGAAFTAFAGGAMNGFDKTMTGATALLPFTRYTEDQIPNYWAYARNFVLLDHFHTTFMGPSGPGHFATVMGQSRRTSNAEGCPEGVDEDDCEMGCDAPPGTTVTVFNPNTGEKTQEFPCFDIPTPFDHLPAGYTWRLYGAKPTNQVKSIAALSDEASHYFKIEDAQKHADPEHTELANVTFAFEYSEHPPNRLCHGENWSVGLINELMSGPHWNEMAIVLLYDDWGGFYDHVTPPADKTDTGEVYSLGFRVPAMIISPYARQGYVMHDLTEQASIPRLVHDLWGAPLMSMRDPNARDGRAGSLIGAFDFDQPPRPPMLLEERDCSQ